MADGNTQQAAQDTTEQNQGVNDGQTQQTSDERNQNYEAGNDKSGLSLYVSKSFCDSLSNWHHDPDEG